MSDSGARSLVHTTLDDFRSSWKSLALTDIAFKIIAFVVLTPLVGFLFRVLIATSGSAVLSDQDILFFFLGPVGWFCIILIGSLWLGIVALEHASLMGILCAATAERRLRLLDAIRFARDNAWPVLQVAARIVGLTLLAVAPFLAVAGGVYFMLLTSHDINYYLSEKPPVFMVALGIGGIIVVAITALLLRLYCGWFFALPLVLFEDVPSSRALRVSVERTAGPSPYPAGLACWLVPGNVGAILGSNHWGRPPGTPDRSHRDRFASPASGRHRARPPVLGHCQPSRELVGHHDAGGDSLQPLPAAWKRGSP